MENNFLTLKKLEGEIKQYIHRYIKEKYHNKKLSVCEKQVEAIELKDEIIRYLKYSYKINDDIIDDIIILICKKGKINLSTLISDIDTFLYKKKGINYQDTNTSFKTNKERKLYVRNYIKKNMTPYGILSRPINHMFKWSSTKTGYEFYANLEQNLTKCELNFFNNILCYIIDCFNKYN